MCGFWLLFLLILPPKPHPIVCLVRLHKMKCNLVLQLYTLREEFNNINKTLKKKRLEGTSQGKETRKPFSKTLKRRGFCCQYLLASS